MHWSRLRQYHVDALAAFQAYKTSYTEQVVPQMTAQEHVEEAMRKLEAPAAGAVDAEVVCCSHCPP